VGFDHSNRDPLSVTFKVILLQPIVSFVVIFILLRCAVGQILQNRSFTLLHVIQSDNSERTL